MKSLKFLLLSFVMCLSMQDDLNAMLASQDQKLERVRRGQESNQEKLARYRLELADATIELQGLEARAQELIDRDPTGQASYELRLADRRIIHLTGVKPDLEKAIEYLEQHQEENRCPEKSQEADSNTGEALEGVDRFFGYVDAYCSEHQTSLSVGVVALALACYLQANGYL
jgi:chromosome segregation ATPase